MSSVFRWVSMFLRTEVAFGTATAASFLFTPPAPRRASPPPRPRGRKPRSAGRSPPPATAGRLEEVHRLKTEGGEGREAAITPVVKKRRSRFRSGQARASSSDRNPIRNAPAKLTAKVPTGSPGYRAAPPPARRGSAPTRPKSRRSRRPEDFPCRSFLPRKNRRTRTRPPFGGQVRAKGAPPGWGTRGGAARPSP